ncbi:MAG: hypothetical protein RLZZ427_490 [Pseudomonadota bacterium]|jgi:zinc protease
MKIRLKVSLITLALLAVPALADEALLKQSGRWVQDYTARKADPAIVFGTLPNGLRYAIMRNTTPSDGVAMRLRIGSGSIEESDEQQGLAHFLEHMAFRGSKHVADGEVVHMLERQGLRFGPDTNAFTAQDQTVYMFNFPKADGAALDTGLSLFREIGERLTLSPAAIEAEKGVVLSEERLRDVPPYRMAKANLGNALAGTRAVQRWPIGTVETIKTATPERLRAYYSANYRPDNATLIVVGNIDPTKVEAQIKARFSDWKASGKVSHADPGKPMPFARAGEFAAPGAPDILTLSWVRPVDQRAETEAVDREQLIQLLGMSVLNNRIADRAAKPGSPFVGGQAVAISDLMNAAALTQIGIAAAPEKWNEALAAIAEEQRQTLAGPISAEELQRARTGLLTQFEAAAQSASTRRNEDIANGLVKAVDEDQLVTSPEQDFAFAKVVLGEVQDADVAQVLKVAFSGQGPILFRSTQTSAAGEAALEAQLAASYTKPLSERTADAAVTWPYADFGAPAKVVAQVDDKELGATVVTFANGSRLMVKQTAFDKGKIYIDVSLGNGRAGAPLESVHALWAAELMPLGGTGKLTVTDIQRWAQGGGKAVGVQAQAGTRAFHLVGMTRPADFLSQMQLLAAYARDPGFRPELGDKLAAIAPMVAGQVETNAGAVFERESQRLFGGGDSRFDEVPSQADLAATKPAELSALMQGALTGPADVTIVGDIDLPAAIAAMQSTFGAGPAAAPVKIAAAKVTMPGSRSEPYVVTHGGREDQAVYGAFWAMPDYLADPKLSHVADVTAAVIEARLVDTVREKLGITYSPRVSATAAIQLPGQGYFKITLETPPANFMAFRSLLDGQLAELASEQISTDELQRAEQPLIDAQAKQRENNQWWIANLPTLWRVPRARMAIVDDGKAIRSVTTGDVQAFAAKMLVGTKPLVIIAKAK